MSGRPSGPTSRRGRPRLQPVHMEWTYARLCRQLTEGHILLRVHHSLSASQLIVSPSPGTSGFFAPSPLFACVTPKTYPLVASSVDPESPWMRELLVDHIRGARRPYRGNNALGARPPDELSPWISCTSGLDWAIWDIARCLSRGGRWSVTLTIIRTDGAERWLRPFARPMLDDPLATAGGPLAYDRELQARRMAASAREVLAYGRIFGPSIVGSLEFTRESLPFDLPQKFFRDPSVPPSAPGWIGKLCWNPQDDSYARARGAIAAGVEFRPEPSRNQHTAASVSSNPVVPPQQGVSRRPLTYAPTVEISRFSPPRASPPDSPSAQSPFADPAVTPTKPAGHAQSPPGRGQQQSTASRPRQARQRPVRRIRPVPVAEQDATMSRRGSEVATPPLAGEQGRPADPAISLHLAINALEFVPRAQRRDTGTPRQDYGPPGANRLTGPFGRKGGS